jgi:Family of unknown function (DUF6174)
MEKIMKKLVLLILAIMLTACSAIQPKSEVDRAIEKWRAANISHYRFNLFIGCFCAYTQDMPLIIEVKDGEVVSMKYQSGKEIESGNLDYFQRFATIDKIFDELKKDLGGEADKVTVEYDETHGFPKQVSIDFIEQAADDELGLTVSEFEKLP